MPFPHLVYAHEFVDVAEGLGVGRDRHEGVGGVAQERHRTPQEARPDPAVVFCGWRALLTVYSQNIFNKPLKIT